jgi:hypothetical protein
MAKVDIYLGRYVRQAVETRVSSNFPAHALFSHQHFLAVFQKKTRPFRFKLEVDSHSATGKVPQKRGHYHRTNDIVPRTRRCGVQGEAKLNFLDAPEESRRCLPYPSRLRNIDSFSKLVLKYVIYVS